MINNKLSLILNKKNWIKKQKFGDEINIDTIIDNYTEFKNFRFENIYQYKKKLNNDITVLILLDSSFSVDSYLNFNIKKLSLIKHLALILSYGMENLLYYQVAAFNSNTRHDCRYTILKNFNEKLSNNVQNILNISAHGYTRIGPSIRHAIKTIETRSEKKKIILLLSDGNPTDYDEYEGWYGVKDIKCAINEGLNNKIQILSVLINNKPETHFLNILGLNKCVFLNEITCKNLIDIANKLY